MDSAVYSPVLIGTATASEPLLLRDIVRSPIDCPEETTMRAMTGKPLVDFAAFMRRLLVAALTLALALPAAASGAKSTGGSQLEGQIRGPDGKAVRGAVVAVRSLDAESSWQSPPSDSRGRFHVKAIPYGWVDLVVTTGKGQFLGDQAINLPPGTKVQVREKLTPLASLVIWFKLTSAK